MLILLRVCVCFLVCFNYACVFSLGDGGENELVHAPHWLEATTRALAMVCLSEDLAFSGLVLCQHLAPVGLTRGRKSRAWEETLKVSRTLPLLLG